ncbi:hypothetical protein MNBD_UNCLBAC01-2161, partial [hydrothermal vent metagenome]
DDTLTIILKNQASTYDQALVVKSLIQMFQLTQDANDLVMAEQIMDFFVNKWNRSGFDMFYDVRTQDAETIPEFKIIHAGPALWIGDAAMDLYEKTGNTVYFNLALEIAQWSMSLPHYESGIAMGDVDTDVPWRRIFSLEHNIDFISVIKKFLKYKDKNMLLSIDTNFLETELSNLIGFIKKRYNPESGLLNRGVGLDDRGIAH